MAAGGGIPGQGCCDGCPTKRTTSNEAVASHGTWPMDASPGKQASSRSGAASSRSSMMRSDLLVLNNSTVHTPWRVLGTRYGVLVRSGVAFY